MGGSRLGEAWSQMSWNLRSSFFFRRDDWSCSWWLGGRATCLTGLEGKKKTKKKENDDGPNLISFSLLHPWTGPRLYILFFLSFLPPPLFVFLPFVPLVISFASLVGFIQTGERTGGSVFTPGNQISSRLFLASFVSVSLPDSTSSLAKSDYPIRFRLLSLSV